MKILIITFSLLVSANCFAAIQKPSMESAEWHSSWIYHQKDNIFIYKNNHQIVYDPADQLWHSLQCGDCNSLLHVLLTNTVDLNGSYNNGWPPLAMALELLTQSSRNDASRYEWCIWYLLRFGASPDIMFPSVLYFSNGGYCVVDIPLIIYAIKNRQYDVVRYLIQHNVRLTVRDSNGVGILSLLEGDSSLESLDIKQHIHNKLIEQSCAVIQDNRLYYFLEYLNILCEKTFPLRNYSFFS